jgi:HK97 family phage portal protein
MGLFGGPRRPVEEPVDRSLTLPASWHMGGDYASLNPANAGTAMQSVAVGATVDLISSLGSELPVEVYTGAGRKITTPGNVLDPAGDGTGVEDWVYQLLMSYLLAGNVYGATTEWAPNGLYRRHADLFNPDDVTVAKVDGQVQWRVKGKVFDRPADFFHRRSNPMPGRLLGLSPIELHASQIGISLSATQFGRQWFTDGAHPSGLLRNEGNLTAEQADIAKRRFLAARGSREPLVLGKGWSYDGIQITPEESQFLETSGMSEAQCARMYGPGFAEILGYATGGSMTYANVVDRRQDLLVLSMNRWLRRVERVLSMLTPAPQVVKLNRDALLEATTLQRYEAHASALTNRWRTVNEVRAIEDLSPVEWGDQPNGAAAAAPTTPPAGGPDVEA